MVKAFVEEGESQGVATYATKENIGRHLCHIMIMYSLHDNKDNYPGPNMDKAYVLVHSIFNTKHSKIQMSIYCNKNP